MTQEEYENHPGWQRCTFEGAELHTLQMGLQTTFREKLEWLEEMETLSLRIHNSHPAQPLISRSSPKSKDSAATFSS